MHQAAAEKVSSDYLEKLVNDAVYQGIVKYEQRQREKEQKRKSDLLYNTGLILDNYLKLKEYQKKAAASLEDLKNAGYTDYTFTLLETFGLLDPGHKTQSLASGIAHTNMLLTHIDRMLDVYKEDCTASARPAVRRRWTVVHDMYLQSPKKSTTEIAETLHVDPRVIQDDAKKARQEITTLFFGIEGLLNNLVNGKLTERK